MRKVASGGGILLAAMLFVTAPASADTRSGSPDAQTQAAMNSLERRADQFKDKFDSALDRSTLNGTRFEDELNKWADVLEDSVDNMAKHFKDHHDPRDSAKFVHDLDNSLIAASGINRVMLRRDFALLNSDWASVRSDLNTIAIAYHRPVLPNVVVRVYSPIAAPAATQAGVKRVMDRLESATDGFEDAYKKSLQHSTANMTNREDRFNSWADQLEDASDDMLKEYSHHNYSNFQRKFEDTMAVAAMINRMMIRSNLDPDTTARWALIRDDLNTLARTFGYPVLPDIVATVQQARY